MNAHIKTHKQQMTKHFGGLRPTRLPLLAGLVAVGIITYTPGWALGQQGLHVVASPFINNSILFGTSAIAGNDIWAVGEVGSGATSQTLAEHFNGTSWSVIATPAVKGGVFNGVDGVAGNDVWAVGNQAAGSSFTTLIEHWDGKSWSVVSGPKLGRGASLAAITAVSSNDVWAAGSVNNFSAILIEHWDGTSWSVVSSPTFTGLGPIHGTSADTSNDVWAEGHGGTGVLRWDGQTWSQVLAATTTFNGNAVAVLSPTNVWVAGSRSGEHPDAAAAIIHWDGTSWSAVAIDNPLAANHVSSLFTGIAAVSANDIWVVGSFTNHWNGTSWSLVNTPSGVALNGVTALSNGTVVAVGGSCSTSCSAVIVQN